MVNIIPRYRTVEGICNNLDNPHWGAAMNGHDHMINNNQTSKI